ncbi:hypothetical protein AB0L42_41760 [Streptomyces sp. NPDC052287]|uniref:hypothetical protein n=1 Tax=Streptomyces sp. NPDC052287 TaxID=3154950 RepID=UPI003445F324
MRRTDGTQGIRLEADLPPDLTEARRKITLAAMSEADAFGHERTSNGDIVWAQINHEDEGRPTSPHSLGHIQAPDDEETPN